MRDATMDCRDLPCAERVGSGVERKLASFDIGMIVAASMGVMVAARGLNLLAGWMT